MELLLTRPVVIGLAVLGAVLATGASLLRTRGIVGERGARFVLHPRLGIGMTERGQIEQVPRVYGQRPFGLRDALLEAAGLLVRPPEVPVCRSEIAIQFQGLQILRDRGLMLSSEVVP